MSVRKYKSVKFDPADHEVIDELRQDIKKERGGKPSIADTVMEAVHFLKKHRENL